MELGARRCRARSAPATARRARANEPWSGGCQSRVATTNGGLGGQPVDRLDDGVAVGDRQRAARTEVVLHVDDDQGLHRAPNIVSAMASAPSHARRTIIRRVLLAPRGRVALEVRGAHRRGRAGAAVPRGRRAPRRVHQAPRGPSPPPRRDLVSGRALRRRRRRPDAPPRCARRTRRSAFRPTRSRSSAPSSRPRRSPPAMRSTRSSA